MEKYLNEENLKKMETEHFEIVSSFIDMILHCRWFHPVMGEMCSVPKFEKNQVKKIQNT